MKYEVINRLRSAYPLGVFPWLAHLVSIHIFLANSSYITIPYFKPMKKWTLVMCPEWKESLDFMYSSDDYYNGEINY